MEPLRIVKNLSVSLSPRSIKNEKSEELYKDKDS